MAAASGVGHPEDVVEALVGALAARREPRVSGDDVAVLALRVALSGWVRRPSSSSLNPGLRVTGVPGSLVGSEISFVQQGPDHRAPLPIRSASCSRGRCARAQDPHSVTQADFTVFALVLAVAAVVGLVATRLRQPLIVAFIGVGILAGPVGFGWVEPDEGVDVLAKLGIAVLLFLVGLKLDVHLIRETGPVALATGLGQVAFTSLVGFGIALALGMDTTTALYVAVALTFSSTIIIVKLLSDKRELEELHGRIAIGFLIVQDIVVVLVMIALTAFGGRAGEDLGTEILRVLATGVALLAGVGICARWLLPLVLPAVARSTELLVLFAVAWAVGLAAISDWLGFSAEVGAFLAGIALASTPYREAVGARLVSLRDFLLLFFFLDLGARLDFADAGQQLLDAAVLSVFVLVGNPLIVLAIMGAMGYRARTSFLAGLTVAQISEFSLILVALGLSLGHIGGETASLVTVVGLVTIGISTYLILSSKPLYQKLAPWLRVFERRTTKEQPPAAGEPIDVVLCGLGRIGGTLAEAFADAGHRVLAVDADPRAVAEWSERGIRTLYGDLHDLHLLEAVPLSTARLVVSTMPSADVNVPLLHAVRQEGSSATVVLVARTRRDAVRYAEVGADVVLEPFSVAADQLLGLVGDGRSQPDDRPASA